MGKRTSSRPGSPNFPARNAVTASYLSKAYKLWEPEFFARLLRQEYDIPGDDQPGVTHRVRADDNGLIRVMSSFGCVHRLALVFFRSAQDHALDSENGSLRLPVLGEIAPVPGDALMWTFLRASLRTCLREHSACSRRQDITWFPERLLLLEHDRYGEGNPKLRLIDTRYDRPQSAYIALSHCWGTTQPIRTTSQNIAAHRDEIEWCCVARTFQDAVTTAPEMDVAYLWIDSLCIVQDDEEDWAQNSQEMDKIYQNAVFVVSAVSSSSGVEPFLGQEASSCRHDFSAVYLRPTDNDVPQSHESSSDPKVRRWWVGLYHNNVTGPLEERAWAYQERFCATRMISFMDFEAKWKCQTAASCECLGRLEDHHRHDDMFGWDTQQEGTGKEQVLTKWRYLVTEYSRRNLTYASDRIPALAGVASKFHTLLKSNYISDIWEMDLPVSLGWHRIFFGPSCAMDEHAPTWSWASMQATCWWLLQLS